MEKLMIYCTRCVLPDTRPGLSIQEDGICNACHSSMGKVLIDWDERATSF